MKKVAAEQAHALQTHAFGRELAHATRRRAYDPRHDDFDSRAARSESDLDPGYVSLTSVEIDIGSSAPK